MEAFESVDTAIKQAVQFYVSRRVPCEAEDLRNEAWRIALENMRRIDLQKGSPGPKSRPRETPGSVGAYLFVTVRRELGRYIAQTLAVPTIPRAAGERAATSFQGRAQIGRSTDPGVPWADLTEPGPNAEQRLLGREASAGLSSWRRRARRIINRHLVGHEERRVAQRLFGLDGRAPDFFCGRVARELALPATKVYKIRARVLKRLRQSAELRRVLEQLHDITNDSPTQE